MMRKAKIRKGCLAGALALLMVVASLSLSGTFAAGLIDTEAKCSLTLSTTGADYAADIETIDEDLHLHDHAIIVNSLLLSIYSIVQQHGDDSADSEELLLVASFPLSDT